MTRERDAERNNPGRELRLVRFVATLVVDWRGRLYANSYSPAGASSLFWSGRVEYLTGTSL